MDIIMQLVQNVMKNNLRMNIRQMNMNIVFQEE